MGLKTRYTKRVFDGSQFSNPLDYDGVRQALGRGWYRNIDSLLALVEFIEGWTDYPTDEDEGIYREFLLGQGDTRWAAKYPEYSEAVLNSRIKDALAIGMLHMTDDRSNHGLRPRAYIYSPSVANLVEEIYADYRKALRDGTIEVQHTREGYTSGVVHPDLEWAPVPDRDSMAKELGQFARYKAHKLLHLIYTVRGVAENPAQEVYLNYMHGLLGWAKNSVTNYSTLGRRLGLIQVLDDWAWPKCFIFSPLEEWTTVLAEVASMPHRERTRKTSGPRGRSKPKKPGPCDELILRVEEENGEFTGAVFPVDLLPEVDLEKAREALEEAGLPLIRWARELEKWTDLVKGECREFHFYGRTGTFSKKRKALRKAGIILPSNSIYSRTRSNHGKGYIYDPRVVEALIATL